MVFGCGSENVTDYINNFKTEIINHSNSNNYLHAIKEWIFYGEVFREESYCICGHDIVENCIIHNISNKSTLITGNCCIKKVGVERKHANKSIKNYLELCKIKCKNSWELQFVNSIIDKSLQYKSLKLSPKQVLILEKISGLQYRFKWYYDDTALFTYHMLKKDINTKL